MPLMSPNCRKFPDFFLLPKLLDWPDDILTVFNLHLTGALNKVEDDEVMSNEVDDDDAIGRGILGL